jgi:hypothetical protein
MTTSRFVSWGHGVAVMAVLWAHTESAAAQTRPTEQTLARQYMAAAAQLFDEGKFEAARDLYARSETVYSTGWARLGIARCERGLGRLGTAGAALRNGMDSAKTDSERNAMRAELESVEAEASTLAVRVYEPDPRLEVAVNERPLPKSDWDVPRYVDGGQYMVRATAPGREQFVTFVEVLERRDNQVVYVPPLPEVPRPSMPPRTSAAPSMPPRTSEARSPDVHGDVQWVYVLAGFSGVAMVASTTVTVVGFVQEKPSLIWAGAIGSGIALTSGVTAVLLASSADPSAQPRVTASLAPGGAAVSLTGVW